MSNPSIAHAPTRSKRRRLRRRQRLVDAARQIIAQKGVASLTVTDVTEAADMAVGSFYTYFNSKDELLETAVWDVFQQLASPELPASLPPNPLDHAYNAIYQVYEFVETHRDLMRAVFGAGHLADQLIDGTEAMLQALSGQVNMMLIIGTS